MIEWDVDVAFWVEIGHIRNRERNVAKSFDLNFVSYAYITAKKVTIDVVLLPAFNVSLCWCQKRVFAQLRWVLNLTIIILISINHIRAISPTFRQLTLRLFSICHLFTLTISTLLIYFLLSDNRINLDPKWKLCLLQVVIDVFKHELNRLTC